MAFGETLRAKRLEKGWTQQELGDRIGKTKNNISQYELGKREPDIRCLVRLADLLDTTLDRLLGVAATPLLREEAASFYRAATLLPLYETLPLEDPAGYHFAELEESERGFFFLAPEDAPMARIQKGDRLLVLEASPKDTGLLLLNVEGRAILRSLRKAAPGRTWLLSADPRVAPEALGKDAFSVLGRVIRAEIEIRPFA